MIKMSKDEVLSSIKLEDKSSLYSSYVKKNNPKLFNSAIKHFKSWRNAITAAGINYTDVSKRVSWNKDNVIKKLQSLPKEELVDKILRKENSGLYTACIRLFGSRKAALMAAGIDYEETLLSIPWTKERVISDIQMYHINGVPLKYKFINTYNKKFRQQAEKFFGSWGDAVKAAGIDYDSIKNNKDWNKPFLSDDGKLYNSKIEGLIANELHSLKTLDKITEYSSSENLTQDKTLCCDFLVVLNNSAKLYLELDTPSKNQDLINDKIKFYEKTNYLFHKISTHRNLSNIIDRYTTWFSIPLVNTLITSHKNPDGDALASIKAVYNHLKSNDKDCCVKIYGELPKNLDWVLDGVELVKKIPDWVENIVVLDCAPTKDRLGWDLPTNIPIFNIDHHMIREEENDPDNNIHVIKGCSTCSLLYSRFGINDDILALGVYTDTLFTKSIFEVLHFILDSKIEEEVVSNYIAKVNSNPDKKVWDILSNIKTHRCRNGFLIAEYDGFASPDVIESIIQILFKLSESVCFIYGKHKKVKLRTSNDNIDLSEIASKYKGGGHPFASVCTISGKVSEFKSIIKSMDVPKILISEDGYGEDNLNE